MNGAALYVLSQRIGAVLSANGHKLTTAESCTGGWIAKCLTDVPGSSEWFDRGFVTYSNASKFELLGVQPITLTTHGAVSEAVVGEMVSGALRRSSAQCAVAVSGVAGPGGGTSDKPVGCVWLAWEREDGGCVTRQQRFDGNREAVRQQAVQVALEGLLDVYTGTG